MSISSELEHSESQPQQVGAGIDFSDPNSPLAPLYLRWVQVAAIGFIALVFVSLSWVQLWHTDVWGHLKYGRWMLDHRQLPDREEFSPWWTPWQPFTQFYTLTQLIMEMVYSLGARIAGGDELDRMAGGVELLRALHAGLSAARFGILVWVFFRLTRSWTLVCLGLVTLMVLDPASPLIFRPQTFAQLFFALLLLPLSRDCLSRQSLIFIPLLLIFWANAHGSYPIGLALLGIVYAGRVLEVAIAGSLAAAWRDPQARRLGAAFALSVLGVAILNPYGPGLFARTITLWRHPSLSAGIDEWQPLSFQWGWGTDQGGHQQGGHWLFMFSLIAIGLTQLKLRRAFPPAHVLLLIAFGLGSALQARFLIWWAMVVPWVLLPRWAEIAATWKTEHQESREIPTLRKTAIAVLLVPALFMWSSFGMWLTADKPLPLEDIVSPATPWQLAQQLRHPDDPDTKKYPELAEVLRTNYPKGKFVGSVMATPMQGDYLMWALAPEIPVTYAHIHLFPPEYWEELGMVASVKPGWWEILDKYRVNLIAMEAESTPRLRNQLRNSKEWRIVLDEYGNTDKPNPLTRQFIAVRINPRMDGVNP